jgi:hypothetical protein
VYKGILEVLVLVIDNNAKCIYMYVERQLNMLIRERGTEGYV